MVKRISAALLLLTGVLLPGHAFAADEISTEDIAAAGDERRAAASRLAATTAEYDANATRAEQLQSELQQLAVELTVRERDLALSRVEAEAVIRQRYTSGTDRGVVTLFAATTVTDLTLKEQYLAQITTSDAATINRLAAVKTSYERQQERVDAAFAEQRQVTAELDLLASRILEELAAADARYDATVAAYQAQEAEKARLAEEERRRQEEERRRQEEEARRAATSTTTSTTVAPPATTAVPPPTTSTSPPGTTTTTPPTTTTTTLPPPPPPPPPITDGKTCPVNGAVAFTDSWGAPRSGGRRHQGVDMIAARGTPLVAIEDGVVFRMYNGGLGGITLWLRATNGDEYYYAHLDAWAPGLAVGNRLAVGDPVGTVGNTGNARYTVPHLHFEYHPGGGAAVNPYPLSAELCL